MKMKSLSFAAMTLLAIGSAQATFNSGGLHDPAGESASFSVDENQYGSYYEELFFFRLDHTSSLKVTAEINNSTNGDWLENNMDLYNYDTDEYWEILPFGTGPSSASFDNLTAGAYIYDVYGVNAVKGLNQVSFSSTFINAVPEPETYALMLGGLSVMGFIARRRKTR